MQDSGREGSALRSPAAWVRFLSVIAVGTAADVLSKYWAWRTLVNPETKWSGHQLRMFESRFPLLEFLWQPNRGAVFGVGYGQVGLFIVFAFLALALLVWLFIDSQRRQWVLQLCLGCVVAGALGNLYDRIMFGHVNDFLRLKLQAPWLPFHWGGPDSFLWPYVFNVADVFISVGVVGLFLVWIVAVSRRHRSKAE